MTSRRSSTRFTLSITAGFALAIGAGVAISACSSSTTEAPAAGTDAAADVIARDTNRPPVDAGPEPDAEAGQTQQQCLGRQGDRDRHLLGHELQGPLRRHPAHSLRRR
jgi:hypothetical protein